MAFEPGENRIQNGRETHALNKSRNQREFSAGFFPKPEIQTEVHERSSIHAFTDDDTYEPLPPMYDTDDNKNYDAAIKLDRQQKKAENAAQVYGFFYRFFRKIFHFAPPVMLGALFLGPGTSAYMNYLVGQMILCVNGSISISALIPAFLAFPPILAVGGMTFVLFLTVRGYKFMQNRALRRTQQISQERDRVWYEGMTERDQRAYREGLI